MSIDLRSATIDDMASLADIGRAANTLRRGIDDPSLPDAAALATLLKLPNALGVVATDHETVIGGVLVVEAREDRGSGPVIPQRGHVLSLAVSTAAWGQQIGSRLLVQLMTDSRSQGYQSLQLWTQTTNTRAASVYERLGWALTGETMTSPDTGEALAKFEVHL